MAGGGNTDFVVNFRAQVKELRKQIEGLKQFNNQQQKQAKVSQRDEVKRERDRQKSMRQRFVAEDKGRRAERDHVKFMSREETKRHKQVVGQLNQQSKEQKKLIRENERLKRRGGAGGAGGQGGGRAFAGGMTGAAIGTAVARAGLGLWNFFVGGVQAGYQNYIQYGQAMGRNAGLASPRSIRRGTRGAMGSKLGFSVVDTAAMVPAMARSTGEAAPREMQQAMRATGQESGEVADVFSTLRRMGFDFTGAGPGKQSTGGKEFQKLIAGGLYSGLERARLPEYFQGVQKIAEEQRNINTGVINVSDIAKQLTLLGRTGQPGLQGGAGAGVLEKFRTALMNPGGGEFGENFIRQAMGFGKPGGSTSFYDAEKMREQGITGSSGAKNIQRIMSELKGQFGTGQEGNLALRELTGVSLDQAEKLQGIYNSGGSSDDQLSKIEDVMKASEPLEKQSLDMMKGIGGTLERIAGLTDRGVGIGAKYASTIEAIEDKQYQALLMISRGIDSLVGYLKELRDFFKGNTGGGKAADIRNSAPGSLDDIRGMTAQHAQAALQKRVGAMGNAYGEATGMPGARELYGALKEASFTDILRGNLSGTSTVRARQAESNGALQDMLRSMGESAAIERIQSKYGPNTKLSPELMQYVNQIGHNAAAAGGVDDSIFAAETMPAPAGMARRKKKTDSGTVTPPKAAGTATDAGGTDSSDDDADRKFAVEVSHVSDDARDKPTTTVQKPGAPKKKSSR